MKRFVSILLVLVVHSLLFAMNGQCDEKKPEITIWMKKQFVPAANDMMVQRGKEFGDKYNVKVNVELIAYENFYPKWTAAIESGQVPDVSFFGYQEVGQFYDKGVLMDVSSLYQKIEKDQGSFYPALKVPITFKGKQYAIPYWTEAQVMYYRKDLLAAAGFNNPPQTWEEFRKIAKATTDGAKGIYGAGIGYGKGNSDAEWFTRSVIWSYGGAEVAKDGKKVIINSPETIQSAKLIADIFLVDKSTPPSAVAWDDSGNNKSYLSGQATIVFNTGSIAAAAKNDNPDLYAKTGLAPWPAGPKGRFLPGIVNNWGIFKKAKNPKLAQQFIEYALDKEWYATWIEKGAPLMCPVLKDLENKPVWSDPMNKAFIQSVSSFTFLGYKGDYSPKAGEIYNLRYINDAFQRMLVDKWAPEKAIQELQTKIEEVYKK